MGDELQVGLQPVHSLSTCCGAQPSQLQEAATATCDNKSDSNKEVELSMPVDVGSSCINRSLKLIEVVTQSATTFEIFACNGSRLLGAQ